MAKGMVTCGDCGHLLVAQLVKRRYIYYHCVRNVTKCDVPHVREEALDKAFHEALTALKLDPEFHDWLVEAIKVSHKEVGATHAAAVARLQGEYQRLDDRLAKMYADRLDGRVSDAMYDRLAGEWRARQDEIRTELTAHDSANWTRLEGRQAQRYLPATV